MNEISPAEENISISVDQPGVYRIKIQGRLSEGTLRQLEKMAIDVTTSTVGILITTLTGQITDQSDLHGIIARIRDLGLPLILVELVSPVDPGG